MIRRIIQNILALFVLFVALLLALPRQAKSSDQTAPSFVCSWLGICSTTLVAPGFVGDAGNFAAIKNTQPIRNFQSAPPTFAVGAGAAIINADTFITGSDRAGCMVFTLDGGAMSAGFLGTVTFHNASDFNDAGFIVHCWTNTGGNACGVSNSAGWLNEALFLNCDPVGTTGFQMFMNRSNYVPFSTVVYDGGGAGTQLIVQYIVDGIGG